MTTEQMTVEQARSVHWLRNNPRPLGELLDEGFLNESRLAWAAEKAYNPHLKQAAGVLLDWLRQTQAESPKQAVLPAFVETEGKVSVIDAPMTIKQAQATLWTFRPFKGQAMGPLLSAQQISLKDLAYAIDNAWDERVRQAAIVLMAVRLNRVVVEPPPAAGPLKVVSSGESYSARRRLAWTFFQGTFFGAIATLLIMLFITSLKSTVSSPLPPNPFRSLASFIGFIIAISFLVFIGWLTNRIVNVVVSRFDNEIDNARKGQEGEDLVIDVLRQNLDGNWTLFRNVVLSGRNKADMDAVLVGPSGVWVLEIKNFTGRYLNYGDRWVKVMGKKRKELKDNPSRQAQRNAARLASFFKADGLKQYVEPVVIWANREGVVKVKQPLVPVWTVERLPEELANRWQDRTLEEATQARIVEKLTDLCERTARMCAS